MCVQKIKDILFPTNVLGKNVISKSCKLQIPEGQNYVNIHVEWEGERLEIAFTHIKTNVPARKRENINIREMLEDGDTFEETYYVGYHSVNLWAIGATDDNAPEHNVIYFKCTNVTKLVCNGEQII